MNTNELINKLTRATHSPRGAYGPTDSNFNALLDSLEEKPVMPAVRTAFSLRRMAGIAACVIVVSTIGWAMVKSFIVDREPVKKILFNHTPMRDVAKQLEQTYHVAIAVRDSSVANFRVSAEFTSDEELSDILNHLSKVASFSVEAKGDSVIIY